MSKLSFRARQLDAYKTMPIYRSEEIPEVTDVAAINRAVPQMPTGMEKEEETEHHLQRALSAQQVYGTSEALVIPIPDIDDAKKQYEQIYPTDYKPPKQYIHAQTYGVDQEIPDYDIDSEDEAWLENQSKKMEITPKVFEEMIDRLEKGSGQQVVELKDAKVLLKEDDDLIITVYDYWLNKRLKCSAHSLIPTVKCEKRDGSTTNNPYVAFRRRTEKMQTRKNRKNDEVSYEKMLKLRRDLQRAVTVLEMIKKREKCKKELLQLTIDILDKRYEMDDFSGSHLNYAEAQKVARSALYPIYNDQTPKDPSEVSNRKLKRKYEKKKHKSGVSQFQGEVDVMEYGSNEDEPLSPGISLSDQEEEVHPDGPFAFRRKKHCSYHAPLDSCGNWPWNPQQSLGHADKRYRYTLTSIDTGPESHRCVGFARRRRGRGGRVILDRAYAEQRSDFWDRVFNASVPRHCVSTSVSQRLQSPQHFTSTTDNTSFDTPTFQDYLQENKWQHFTACEGLDSGNSLFNGALLDLSSDDVNEALDPIIDIVPEPVPSSLPLGFVPIVTAPSHSLNADLLSQSLPTLQTSDNNVNVLATNCDIPDSTAATTAVSPPSAKLTMDYDYDPHHRQLQTLKQGQHVSTNRASTCSRLINQEKMAGNDVSNPVVTATSNKSSSLDTAKVTYAVSTLVNGPTLVRSNGIKHINGPIKELRHGEVHSAGSVMVKGIHKLNYPLTPSSDTSDTPTSLGSDLMGITTIPGESGDNMTSSTRLITGTDFTDSAGLNSIADVVSTMEVT